MKNLKLILSLALIAIGLFLPAQALCQTVTWTSSNPAIATVDAAGLVTSVGDGTVTITAVITQNGKTVTSSKTVETALETCTSCFTFNSLTYCGVKLSNGQCWLDRDLGATALNGVGAGINSNAAPASCPAGWRLPYTDEFVAMARIQTGNNSITATYNRESVSAASMGAAPMRFAAASAEVPICNHIWQQDVSGNRMHCSWYCGYSSMAFCKNNEPIGPFSVRCIKG